MVKIALIENNELQKNKFQFFFKSNALIECTMAVNSGELFLKYAGNLEQFDIILLDINLGGKINGMNLIQSICKKNPSVEICVYTYKKDNTSIFQAISRGAGHYILKGESLEILETQLINIYRGDTMISPKIARVLVSYFHSSSKSTTTISNELTAKEIQVIKFIVDGLSYKMIADNMGISINGARYYIRQIYKKLEINSKAEVIRLYLDGFIE